MPVSGKENSSSRLLLDRFFLKQLFIYLAVLEIQTQQFAPARQGLFHLLKSLGQYFDFCIYYLFFSLLVQASGRGKSVWASF